jgi:hypothetical protein
MKMKLLPTIIAATGFLTASLAFSATYQGEISAAYGDIDTSDSEEGYMVGVEGKYYFAPVDTTNHPLAEAAFIEKANNVYVNLGNYEYKDSGERTDIYMRSVGIDFYIPNSMIYLGAGVVEGKAKSTWSMDGYSESYSTKWDSSWFVKAGIAPITGLLVWSEFTEDVDVSDEWNINGKYVLPLAGEQALNIEASYEQSDVDFEHDTITGAVDYYLDRNLSLGAGFVNTSFDNSIGDDAVNDYFIRARNFFTDNISAEISYTDGDYEDSLMFGGTIRF